MTETIELHGRLPDKHPCKLLLGPEQAVLEIAADVGPRTAFGDHTVADPTVVTLFDGRIATLKGNYLAAGSRSETRDGRTFALTRIGTNQVLVGPRTFTDADLVSGITFRPTNDLIAQYYTAHRGHVRAARTHPLHVDRLFSRSSEYGEIIIDALDENRLTICKFEQDNLTVTLYVSITEASNALGTRIDERRSTRISYKHPVPLDVAFRDVMVIIHFFSFTVGGKITPTEIKIASGPEDNFHRRPLFDLHVWFPRETEMLDPKEALRCLISQPIDGDSYKECLQAWLGRRDNWMQSYYLGSETLASQGEISRHRYLDAAAWFESIPPFYQDMRTTIPRGVIDQVSKATAASFKEQGVEVPERRVRDLFGPLHAPPLAARLRAAMSHIRVHFGEATLPLKTEDLIPKITRLRGRLAHGEDPIASDDARDMHELTLLLETVCGFLTLSGLPWSLGRLDHAHLHPMQWARAMLFHFHAMRTRRPL
jgi:hypothetical protein